VRAIWSKIGLVAALLALVGLGGCGDLGEVSGRVEQPALVTKRQIDRYPAGSPARTALEWWRALQYQSAPLASHYYSDRLDVTPRRLARQLKAGPQLLDLRAGLAVDDVTVIGDRATVLAVRTRVLAHPNGRTDRVRIPQVVSLRREAGEWKLADNRYLDQTLHAVHLFMKNAPKSQPAP
jgi:hypothetical protein